MNLGVYEVNSLKNGIFHGDGRYEAHNNPIHDPKRKSFTRYNDGAHLN